MGWKLREDLSFCRVGSRLIFLDIGKDRYFQLPDHLERGFVTYIDGHPGEPVTNALVEHGILLETTEPCEGPTPTFCQTAIRSVIEDSANTVNLRPGVLLEVMRIVFSTGQQLKRKSLKENLDKFAAYRQDRTLHARHGNGKPMPQCLFDSSVAFMRARRHVPINMTCLLDSLSMLRFLANRGLHAEVVFAVTCDPFSAHCWVQSGDIVLNDTVGSANAHTPIWIL